MSSLFGGNPFSTPVGQRIEQATDGSLASENWALNMEICDIINETEDGPKDGIKAIKKRLQQNVGKNYTIVMFCLTVLESCVKNCGKRFQLLVANKEFVQELVKMIGPKNDPPTVVQEKVLSLIQSWADAFKSNPEMAGVMQVYNDLKQKGIEFPMTDLDTLAPIHTPQRSVPDSANYRLASRESTRPPPPPPTNVHNFKLYDYRRRTGSAVILSPESLAKLRSELDVVQGNMKVFSEMITELTPGKEHPSDLELLLDLNKTCKAMQTRVVQLIDKVGNEEVTNELLRINDELNNVFLRYARYEKNKSSASNSQRVTQNSSPEPPPKHNVVESKPLIDLGADSEELSNVNNQLSGLTMNTGNVASTLGSINTVPAATGAPNGNPDSDFDMFAQSRNTTFEQSKQSGSTYLDNTNVDQASSLGAAAQQRNAPIKLQKGEQHFDEMERWLRNKPSDDDQPQDSITSSEFDKFLAERAAVVEPTSQGTTHSPKKSDNPETEKVLFPL
ncbi:TOM1-like protein 2 [Nymphon striatum]|nr:TOM1-like protein 2 [Nymphon striatum]